MIYIFNKLWRYRQSVKGPPLEKLQWHAAQNYRGNILKDWFLQQVL